MHAESREHENTGREQLRARRPVRFVTEECVIDTTSLASDTVMRFCEATRSETRADTDLIAQLMAALGRFKIRLTRRTQYAKLQELTQPGSLERTARRLDDERAALSVIQAQSVAVSVRANHRNSQVGKMLHAERDCGGAKFELSTLSTSTARLVANCDELITETRRTIRDYTATIRQL